MIKTLTTKIVLTETLLVHKIKNDLWAACNIYIDSVFSKQIGIRQRAPHENRNTERK